MTDHIRADHIRKFTQGKPVGESPPKNKKDLALARSNGCGSGLEPAMSRLLHYCKTYSVFLQIYPLLFLHFRRFHHSSSGFQILKWNLCRSVRGTSHKVNNTGLLPFVDSHCKVNLLCPPNNISSRHLCSGALYHLHIIKILIELIHCFYVHTLEYIRISVQCSMYVFMP